jgi:Protein of unknown function (DUF3558)
MPRYADLLLVTLLLAACGGGDSSSRSETASASAGSADDEDVDACTLLTSEEIQAATGWAPDTSASKSYGTTSTCAYHGKDAVKQSVVLVVARPAPKVSTSAELAARRNEQAQRQPDIKMVITPLEGLGVPAVRSELEGSSQPTIEAVVGRRLLGVTTSDFEASKALVPKAAARLR